ncbi:ATP-dependent DNA helicase [Neocallimastix lanati (nom. inval.)]|uniref:ATP-dependent DNA helicase n=1 Tax=Neocallimastix californiae TaxID=1754190 RepID=A0A1Y2BRE2_9FUNG|nr:ATP-dependent DNA helicase [Neocallimastix sp. JGI-2020a]ORY37311.1 ATP-dependent DNA helicase [Neocallimastix californiae]|eukprot:ORY37311.1 ATP-dependent DNA helicase [Neocallimastix californiae]
MKEIEVEDSTIKNINSPEYVLKHVFKLKSFRHPQQEIIEHALKGYNIFVLMPTVTPELMATNHFRNILIKLNKRKLLARLVVDEAHCISSWGHDFRSDYLKLNWWKLNFPKLPITALTATATEQVQDNILTLLKLKGDPRLKIFKSSFRRENLYYEVRFKGGNTENDCYKDCLETLRKIYKNRRKRLGENSKERPEGVCIIIYCYSREECDTVAQQFKKDGINAASYHAGMSSKNRDLILEKWSKTTSFTKREEALDVIVATISFGMGIDKADVRLVIHWSLPKSLEAYYQESGRAGRDGNISRCILYYSREDRDRACYHIRKDMEENKDSHASEKMNEMIKYCENTSICRHAFILNYFGEKVSSSKCPHKRCDICKNKEKVIEQKSTTLSNLINNTKSSTNSDSDIKFYKGAYIKFSSDTGISNQDGELGNNDFGVYESYNRSSYKRSYSHTYDDDDIESDEDRYESSSYEPKRTKTLGELLFNSKPPKKEKPPKPHAFSKYIISTLGLDLSKNHFIAGLKLSGREACYKLLYKQMEIAVSNYKDIWESKKEGKIKDLSDEEKNALIKDVCVEAEAKCFYSVRELSSYKSLMGSRVLQTKKIIKNELKDNNNILVILLEKLEKYKV